jgi:hypothetical protein
VLVVSVPRKSDRKEVRGMAVYKIIRIYHVQAENQIEASERMMEALEFRVERDYHIMDYIKSPDDEKGKGRKIDLRPPKGFMTSLIDQLLGRSTRTEWKKPEIYKGKDQGIVDPEEG